MQHLIAVVSEYSQPACTSAQTDKPGRTLLGASCIVCMDHR